MGTAAVDKPKPNVRMTPRDAAALEWLSQMYGAPLDVVAALTQTTQKRAYALVARWKAAGWVDTGRINAGPMWVWPKRKTATAYLGWDPDYWVPRGSTAEHFRATAVARLALTGADTSAWWSERQLRHEQTRDRKTAGSTDPYLADGRFLRAEDGRWYSIEVELNSKGTTRTRHVVAQAAAALGSTAGAGVLYACASEAVASVVRKAVADNAAKFGGPKGEDITRAFNVRLLSDLVKGVRTADGQSVPATTGLIMPDEK